ncbi:MAG TPA: hypothetical protein VEB22_13285 [Phycisphaerales bacterium]|nr:hypothetical protein [Phycisphaerales bacterium]
MTTFATKRAALAGHTGAQRSIGTLSIRWLVARTDGPAVLTLTVTDAHASAELTDATGSVTPVARSPRVHTERADGLEHVEAEGLLSLTVRRCDDGGAVLLFARTPLLESLGVAGGCIERPVLEAS